MTDERGAGDMGVVAGAELQNGRQDGLQNASYCALEKSALEKTSLRTVEIEGQISNQTSVTVTRQISLPSSVTLNTFSRTNPQTEYTASQIRKILQQLFPRRRLVLSQFTFFNQIGIARPTGTTLRRGRRCYKVEDILPIACVLALKEEGIPYKNVEPLPVLIQENAARIFSSRTGGCRLAGFGETISLMIPGERSDDRALEAYLSAGASQSLFWSYDLSELAHRLEAVCAATPVELRRAA